MKHLGPWVMAWGAAERAIQPCIIAPLDMAIAPITAVQKQADVSICRIRGRYMMPQKTNTYSRVVLQGTCIFKDVIVVGLIVKGRWRVIGLDSVY